MRIKVKLMGMLKDHTPERGELDLPEDATIGLVLQRLSMEGETIQAFSVNGSIEKSRDRQLADGDELVVLPPVGGG